MLYDERNNLETKQIKQKYGFLYRGYKKKSYYWEVATMFRKVLVTFVSVFLQSSGSSVQALLLLLILISYIYMAVRARPYLSNALNKLEI